MIMASVNILKRMLIFNAETRGPIFNICIATRHYYVDRKNFSYRY